MADDRRSRHLCEPCERVRRHRVFWAGVPASLERHQALVGEEYARLTLADFEPTLAARGEEAFRRQALQTGTLYGMRLQGEVGAGKTAFAAALARLWVFAGRSVRFVPVRQLFRSVRDTYNAEGGATESDVVEPMLTVDLLILDDLGREGGGRDGLATEHVLSVLHEIVDERIRWHRPTILTTNLNGAALAGRYGGGLASRFGLYDTVVIRHEDRRKELP